jgi:FKBP12-rapamycin complex-associated protein
MASPVTDFESSSQGWSEVLANIFRDIKTRKKETRVDGAAKLRQYVAEQTHEMKGEFFTHFMHDINEYIKDLTKSSAAQDVLGGIMALDKLLDVEYDLNDGIFVTQWAAYLRTALHQSENIQVVTEASRCLGRLARIYQHTMPREFIDFEIRQALEWLLSGHHFRATTAVCVLAELLQNVPTLINVEHVESFVDLMWLPLRDNDITLREGTVEVLRWSLKVVKDRSRELRLNLYKKVYALAENGFKVSKMPDSIHGSMLVFGEVLADNCEYLNDKYEEVSKMILSMREHKSQLIRHTVIQLIPQLAKFNPHHFADQNIATCTEHLLASLSNKKERGAVLLALGEMALVLKERINPVLGSIINIITQAFTARFGKNLLCPELFKCISMLAIALGGDLAIHMKPILPQMFATEFSQILIDTLSDIAHNIPSLRDTIQERLLNVLSMYLTTKDSGRPLHRQSIVTPSTSNNSSSLSSPRDASVLSHSPVQPGPNSMMNLLPASLAGDRTPMIILSLHTLATFEFDSSVTRDLVHNTWTMRTPLFVRKLPLLVQSC